MVESPPSDRFQKLRKSVFCLVNIYKFNYSIFSSLDSSKSVKMTKLGEWLFGLTLFFGVYMAVVSKQVKHELIDKYFFEIQILPLILIVLLGVSN